MIPTQTDIEMPLLKALLQLGGIAKPKQIYPILTAAFPEMTPEDLAETLLHGESKFRNRVQWTRQRLIDAGQNGERGLGTLANHE